MSGHFLLDSALSFYHPFDSVHVCAVDMTALVKWYFPGIALTSPALDRDSFEQILFESGVQAADEFLQCRVFKRQIEWLGGRIAFNRLDHLYFGGSHTIEKRETGEPFIRGSDYSISISHAGDYACAACSLDDSIIGIDIERIRPFDNKKGFFSVAFPEEKYDDMIQCTDYELVRRWTMKESFLKIIGRGFGERLAAVKIRERDILYNETKTESAVVHIEINGHILTIVKVPRAESERLRTMFQ
jgi:phosphopantetheinyl transferase